jgi:hypothetical protein
MTKPSKKPEPSKEPVAPYQPTPKDTKALQYLRARRVAERPLTPRLKVSASSPGVLKLDHVDERTGSELLMLSIGSEDPDFLNGLITQLCNAGKGQTVDEDALNFMLSMIKGVEPRDQVEAMLAAQMAATHNATMTFARRLANVETLPQQDSAERAYNKLARTFAMQVEALKRYRSQGEQVVRVERVTVHEGGQAIVGNVSHGAGGRGAPSETGQSS